MAIKLQGFNTLLSFGGSHLLRYSQLQRAPAQRGHCRFHVYNGPCAKKKFGLGRPLKALRPLEGPGEARDHQGPPGINAVVKRNRLSQKNFCLGRPLMASRPLEGSGGAGHHQGPPGIDTGVKRNNLSQKKIRPRPAFGGLWRPPEAITKEGRAIFELVLT